MGAFPLRYVPNITYTYSNVNPLVDKDFLSVTPRPITKSNPGMVYIRVRIGYIKRVNKFHPGVTL